MKSGKSTEIEFFSLSTIQFTQIKVFKNYQNIPSQPQFRLFLGYAQISRLAEE